MKKLLFAASLVVASLTVNAQDEGFTSKNGHQVLPEAGNWGLSIDAIPVLNFVGNAFNFNAGGTANTVSNNYAGTPFTSGAVPVVTGRKMLDANTAIRARFGVNLYSNTVKTRVNVLPATTPVTYTEDKVTNKASNFYISGGLEKRKGSHRVQGIYGAELVVAVVANQNTKYEYANAINAQNPVGSRVLEEKRGNTLSVGPRAFVGVEYFFAPKISLGAEFGYGIYLQKTGASETTSEGWSAVNSAVETTTVPTAGPGGVGSGSTNFTTDNLGGTINLNFFF